MILKSSTAIVRFSNRSVGEVEAYINSQGDGLYTVGLDDHVGFVMKQGAVIRFIHSNYYQEDIGVMAEPLDGINPFAHSKYRVIGTLFDDAKMMAWLTGAQLDE